MRHSESSYDSGCVTAGGATNTARLFAFLTLYQDGAYFSLSETADERVNRLVLIESLQTRYALVRAGVSEEDADAILAERAARRAEFDVALTGVGGDDEGEGEREERQG